MVDEAQDCSNDDWNLLRILSERHGNLFVVGDPDQAIYEWRGASPRTFVDFKATTDIILDRNYRSTPDILNVANAIIAHNRNRIPKELYTARLNETPVTYRHYRSEREEAQAIADTIAEEIKQGAAPNQFAILFRSTFLSRNVEQAMLKLKIPYAVWGGVRFFERKEIKDVICYLRMVASDSDDTAFTRIVNLPSRKFGAVSLQALTEIAEKRGIPLLTALRNEIEGGNSKFDRPALRQFVALIDLARSLSTEIPVSELTDRILVDSRLADLYRLDEKEERLENVSELVNAMKEFERVQRDDGDMTLDGYLQEIALYTNADSQIDTDRVKLMTIHQSKGLEFDTVFITGLTEGVFPNHRSIRERRQDGEEEERRLMYVAATRARNMLYLSESEGYMNDTGAMKYPSRFLAEIPEDMLIVEGNPDPELFKGTKRLVDSINSELGEGGFDVWPPGTRVEHRAFGQGEVVRFDPQAQSYRIRFSTGERDLVPRVLKKI